MDTSTSNPGSNWASNYPPASAAATAVAVSKAEKLWAPPDSHSCVQASRCPVAADLAEVSSAPRSSTKRRQQQQRQQRHTQQPPQAPLQRASLSLPVPTAPSGHRLVPTAPLPLPDVIPCGNGYLVIRRQHRYAVHPAGPISAGSAQQLAPSRRLHLLRQLHSAPPSLSLPQLQPWAAGLGDLCCGGVPSGSIAAPSPPPYSPAPTAAWGQLAQPPTPYIPQQQAHLSSGQPARVGPVLQPGQAAPPPVSTSFGQAPPQLPASIVEAAELLASIASVSEQAIRDLLLLLAGHGEPGSCEQPQRPALPGPPAWALAGPPSSSLSLQLPSLQPPLSPWSAAGCRPTAELSYNLGLAWNAVCRNQ